MYENESVVQSDNKILITESIFVLETGVIRERGLGPFIVFFFIRVQLKR